MDRCGSAEMRKNLEVTELFKNAGIDFVPIPVRNAEHKKELIKTMEDAFNAIIAESENT
jgi:protein tyrosine phosphatase (PTP) superfamily phosphohydrolase (DUF442 family)